MAKRINRLQENLPKVSQKPYDIIIRGAQEFIILKTSTSHCRVTNLIVFTGVSGSGKSSLAFDTIYAEGQRRYVESLSSYARQFLGANGKTGCRSDPRNQSGNCHRAKDNFTQSRARLLPPLLKSTITFDLLFGRIGQTYCRVCGKLVKRDTVTTVVDRLQQEPDGAKSVRDVPNA
jgi:excinuclease ABC subunit A